MKDLRRFWYSWDPQPTWGEVARLTIYETVICLVLIATIQYWF